MHTTNIIAFLIPMRENVAVLPLTKKYQIDVKHGSDISRFNVLNVDKQLNSISQDDDLLIDSITVVYGENGEGKTRLLLNICHTLGRQKGERPLGVLWETNGNVYFDPGSHLKYMECSGNSEPKIHPLSELTSGFISKVQMSTPVSSTFYTTSPFETLRRRSLKSGATIDVTPEFVTTNQFSGISFLQSALALPSAKEIPFIEDAKIRLKIKVQSLEWVFRDYISNRDSLSSKGDISLAISNPKCNTSC